MIINFNNIFDLIGWFSVFGALIPFILYCEIHYKFSWFRGFLYHKNPEILFDMPRRINGTNLPVLLMVKDSNKRPVYIEKVEIIITNGSIILKKFDFKINKSLSQLFFSKIFNLDVKKFQNQEIIVKCIVWAKFENKTKKIINHNFPKKYNSNFHVFIDNEIVEIPADWKRGDLHVHSNYTEDQVEFGPELSTYIAMGKSLNLDFVGVLDHSYDLDDAPGTWTFRDDNFTKWKNFKEEVQKLNNKETDFTILPGYELSVDNGLGENVHLAVMNNDEIFHGSGDAMENHRAFASENYYFNILEKLNKNALAFAAHPNAPQKFLHKKILKRGEWNHHDCANNLSGFQILNGNRGQEFESGKKMWIEKILSGRKQYLFAGTDAHGNFNYNLSIKYPLLSMKKNQNNIFGEFISFVKINNEVNVQNFIDQIKMGKIVVSDGPFLNIEIKTNSQIYGIGDEIDFLPETLNISAFSNNYFGTIDYIRIIVGNCHEKCEQSLELHDIYKNKYYRELGIILKSTDCYIRAEMVTTNNRIALTNPIWIDYS